MNIKVSVIIPALNVVSYIRECMDSVISQSMRDLEILCVDAGSTDGTREILEEYAQKDTRITVLDSCIKSYGKQINIGLDYASGDYIAILESDDWAAKDMYQCLYDHALKDAVDYAAADFDTFFRLQSGSSYYVRQRLFDVPRQDWYGRVLNSDEIATLRASDYVLWKGIYKRQFLEENHIRLHESPGAAFQDMGFLQQVKTYAKRAKYLDQSFYRYRQGREDASSNKLDGLRFYKEEFEWIHEELRLTGILNEVHKKYYYHTMSISLITKYEQILSRLNGNWHDQRLSGPYQWFREQVTEAVQTGLLEQTMYAQDRWERLQLLLTSQEAHAQLVMDMQEAKSAGVQEFQSMIKGRSIVIFGCGMRGERLMLFCHQNRMSMYCFCDNNKALHGQKKFGYSVISPSVLNRELVEQDAVVVLSMREGIEQVRMQLTSMGIDADRIVGRIPKNCI